MAKLSQSIAGDDYWHPLIRYERWLQSLKIPVHREYFVEDLRTLPLGPWEERECDAAIVVFSGQEGVSETRVTEIPPAATLPPLKFALDELVYVLEGRGVTTVWSEAGGPRKSFEWQKHSLFLLPRFYTHQFGNVQGHAPARLVHLNHLPLVMSVIPEPGFFFNNPHLQPEIDILSDQGGGVFSEAKWVDGGGRRGAFWISNFFPDVRAWDKLLPSRMRGLGSSAALAFPHAPFRVGLPTMPVGIYKKAHAHGPGILIVVPGGEGMSVMWPEGEEKKYFMWHEGSAFVPPKLWWHQHFNVGTTPARYITMHLARNPLFGGFGYGSVEYKPGAPRENQLQIEYPDEDPRVRARFELELSKRGGVSLMPEQAYKDPNYQWEFDPDSVRMES